MSTSHLKRAGPYSVWYRHDNMCISQYQPFRCSWCHCGQRVSVSRPPRYRDNFTHIKTAWLTPIAVWTLCINSSRQAFHIHMSVRKMHLIGQLNLQSLYVSLSAPLKQAWFVSNGCISGKWFILKKLFQDYQRWSLHTYMWMQEKEGNWKESKQKGIVRVWKSRYSISQMELD